MKKNLFKKCVLSSLLSACLILIVSTILILKEQPFTLRASSKVNENKSYVYPIGLPVGLYMETDGVLVVDNGIIEDENSNKVSPLQNIVNPGDYLVKFNEENIESKDGLMKLINQNGSKKVNLTVNRNGNLFTVETQPIKTKSGEYMIGVWVRDDTQGIGTLTCITTTDRFTGLGHGITDIDTLDILDMEKGKIYYANIWGIKKGEKGKPGGLCGSIEYKDKNIIGTIESNSTSGINGTITADLTKKYNLKLMEVASAEEVKSGDAVIQVILDGKVEQYDVKISNFNKLSKEKSMLIEVTDKELLEKTNGIVQGMSGSPIIQDGKIVGAITHVLVNDPTTGYGIFIENMLEH